MLHRYRADINALAIDKKMPLHFAAEKGHDKILRLLLENGLEFCKQAPHCVLLIELFVAVRISILTLHCARITELACI